jgi:hypothetical protein
MKQAKMILLGAILVFTTVCASAFDVTVGIQGGVAYPWFSGSDYDALLDLGGFTHQARFGFSAGAFTTVGIIDVLAIQPEIMYSRFGGNYGDSSVTWYHNAGVIEIPLLLKLRLKMTSWVRFCPVAGVDALLKIGDWDVEEKDSSGNILSSGTATNIRVPIIGVLAGVGWEFPVGRGWVTISARYHIGVMNRFTADSPIEDWKQNSLQLLLGYGYSVLKK